MLVPIRELWAQQITWTTLGLSGALAGRYDDIYFVSPQVGWAIDGDSGIFKTTDGGTSWNLQFDNFHNYLRSIRFVDSLHGWCGTLGLDTTNPYSDSTILYETKDGGITWSIADSKIQGTKPAGLCGIFAVDSSNIYICGKYTGPSYILKTTNGGQSWKSIDMNAFASRLVDIYFWSTDSGIVVGGIGTVNNQADSSSALVLFTSDGGGSWRTVYRSDTIDGYCWKISFPTQDTGYISIESWGGGPFLTTTNRGLTWVKRVASQAPVINLQGIGFINGKLGWTGGWGISSFPKSQDVLVTTDGGNSWTQTKLGLYANRFRFFGDTLGYCAGNQVYKISITWPETVKSGNDISQFSMQNNPNPFHNHTEIHFTLPREEHIALALFDLEGKKILDVLDGIYSVGEHTVPMYPNIPHDNISAGTYIYELTSEDGSIARNMIHLQ